MYSIIKMSLPLPTGFYQPYGISRIGATLNIGPGSSQAEWALLPSGAMLRLGETGWAPPGSREIQLQVEVMADTLLQLEQAARELEALRGHEGRVWREWWGSHNREWCGALLTDVDGVHTPDMVLHAVYNLKWQRTDPGWKGLYHGPTLELGDDLVGLESDVPLGTIDDTTTLNTSPKTLTINNSGPLPVLDAILTITAGSASITALSVTSPGVQWTFSGTIAAGQSLVIDAGRHSVKNNGVAAYSHVTRLSGQPQPALLRILPGETEIVITRVSAAANHTASPIFWELHP